MTEDQRETVLLSLVGTSPAVLTETVWALAHQEEPEVPDRIVVITTAPGRDLLKEKLFDHGHWENLKSDLAADGIETEGKLRFSPIGDCIRVIPNEARTEELVDVRTIEDNHAVAEYLMEVVRGFTENDSLELIVSLSGGRKTTSALFHSVMTLLGRQQDKITHVVIDDVWIRQSDFFYPGCKGDFRDPDTGEPLDNRNVGLDLAEVPFVPLRYLFKRDLEKSAGSFIDLMNSLRTRAVNLEDELSLTVDTATGEIRVNDSTLRPSPKEFLLYLFFAIRAGQGLSPIDAFKSIEADQLETLRNAHVKPDDFGHWSHLAEFADFVPTGDPRRLASSLRVKFRNAGFDGVQIERLVPHGGYLAIAIPRSNIEIR